MNLYRFSSRFSDRFVTATTGVSSLSGPSSGSKAGFEATSYFRCFAQAYQTQQRSMESAERELLCETAVRASTLVKLVHGLVKAGVVDPKDRLSLVKNQLRRLRKELEDEPVALDGVDPKHSLVLLRLMENDPVLPLVLR